MAAAAVIRPSHRAARVTAAPTAGPRSPLREIRDTTGKSASAAAGSAAGTALQRVADAMGWRVASATRRGAGAVD